MVPTVNTLLSQHGVWGEHSEHSIADWKYAIKYDKTRLGYWEWVVDRLQQEADDASYYGNSD